MSKGGVNVYSEWGKLEEIIVGHASHTDQINVDISFRLLYHQAIKDVFLKNSYSLQKLMIEQRQEDLDNLHEVLEKLDIVVKRPRRTESVQEFRTPHFTGFTTSANNPRDQLLIAGNEIIETSCVNRNRYFENDQFKTLLYEYFDRGSRWTCAPRPTMRDESFDFSKVQEDPGRAAEWSNFKNQLDSFEMMFDAAQCLKFGRDIVMNISNANHELGARWLERHLDGKFRLHRVYLTDYHIDGMFMPLRPGVLLINPLTMYDKLSLLPPPLRKWDVLIVPEADKSTYPEDSVLLASMNINVNVLPIDGDKVIVFNPSGTETNPLVKILERHGFTPIQVRLRHSRVFDGGAHCATLDTIRKEGPEDYFS